MQLFAAQDDAEIIGKLAKVPGNGAVQLAILIRSFDGASLPFDSPRALFVTLATKKTRLLFSLLAWFRVEFGDVLNIGAMVDEEKKGSPEPAEESSSQPALTSSTDTPVS